MNCNKEIVIVIFHNDINVMLNFFLLKLAKTQHPQPSNDQLSVFLETHTHTHRVSYKVLEGD